MISDETADETWWERIRWPDEDALPLPGRELSVPSSNKAEGPSRVGVVVYARPVMEPGWIEVELRAIE